MRVQECLSSVLVKEGKPASMCCKLSMLAEDSTKVTFKWYKDCVEGCADLALLKMRGFKQWQLQDWGRGTVSWNSSSSEAFFTIGETTLNDTGTYVCEVQKTFPPPSEIDRGKGIQLIVDAFRETLTTGRQDSVENATTLELLNIEPQWDVRPELWSRLVLSAGILILLICILYHYWKRDDQQQQCQLVTQSSANAPPPEEERDAWRQPAAGEAPDYSGIYALHGEMRPKGVKVMGGLSRKVNRQQNPDHPSLPLRAHYRASNGH
ncbi:uncharacterized protein LOC106706674 [Latimeria chalumnae]|uniref:uncharacterized protein LOC106706674 n=1 Tax=Latimeria chalumnae TaxID=7897 RepID=UPI0006D8EE98|nr:PREDICTED: uncharacterized protein LOC106706674 [Latimeria chalumnae]|eukprot:XP_014353427.1 PREDICTED: uncharacterized protein LOC106706674 [Latimeria chalumnae]